MKNSIIVIICLFFLISTSIFPQWFFAGNTSSQTYNLGAIDSSYAVISGTNQGLYKTTNGGSSWELLNNPISSSIIGISFVDTSHIWIAGESATIYKSTDGGNTWIEQYNDTSQTDFFNHVKMFDLNNGIAMGDAKSDSKPALFLRTTDGGNNWTSKNLSNFIGKGSGDLWRRIDFPDISSGYFFPSPYLGGKNLYKTTDGGCNASREKILL